MYEPLGAGFEDADSRRREVKGLVWKVDDAAGKMQLCYVAGTEGALCNADHWRAGQLRGVVGLPEPQCQSDPVIAERLGLDTEGVKRRQVSHAMQQQTCTLLLAFCLCVVQYLTVDCDTCVYHNYRRAPDFVLCCCLPNVACERAGGGQARG